MKHKILITALTAVGLSLSGASHALLIMMPNGTKTQAQVVGNKLMLQDAKGKLTPAGDGIYKSSDGNSFFVRGGGIVPGVGESGQPTPAYVPGGGPIDNKSKALPGDQNKLLPAVNMGSPVPARDGISKTIGPNKPDHPDKGPNKPDRMMSPSLGGPAAPSGGIMMDKDKPDQEKPKQPDRPKPDKPDKKGQITPDPDTSGPGSTGAAPVPPGIQAPAKALPMPQGTQGSGATLGSPKDPPGPPGSSGGFAPPPR